MPISKETEAIIEEELDRQRIFRNRMERCFGFYADFDQMRRSLEAQSNERLVAEYCALVLDELISTVKVLTESMMGLLEKEG